MKKLKSWRSERLNNMLNITVHTFKSRSLYLNRGWFHSVVMLQEMEIGGWPTDHFINLEFGMAQIRKPFLEQVHCASLSPSAPSIPPHMGSIPPKGGCQQHPCPLQVSSFAVLVWHTDLPTEISFKEGDPAA